jgi:hypothetical protein
MRMIQPAKPRRRPFGWLAVLILVFVGLWTGFWFYVRGEIGRGVDDFLAQARMQGVDLTCNDRTIGGWPFRIEVRCKTPGLLTADGTTLDATALTVSGLVYRPDHYIADLTGPLTFSQRDRGLRAEFKALRASLRLEKGEIARASVVADEMTAVASIDGAPDRILDFRKGELHVLSNGPGKTPALVNYDLSGLLEQASLVIDDQNYLNAPADVTLDAAFANLRRGRELDPRAFAANEGRLDIRSLGVEVGDAVLTSRGSVFLNPDGKVGGGLQLRSATRADASAPAKPKTMQMALVLGAFMAMGKPEKDDKGRDGRMLDVAIDHGTMKIGQMKLGTLQPLF